MINSQYNDPNPIDILIICAVKEEFDQLINVTDHLVGNKWHEGKASNGRSVSDAELEAKNGRVLNIRATWGAHMGREQAQAVASPLLNETPAKLLAMSGFCAGRRGKVQYGDVIFADRLWSYDSGKIKKVNGVEDFKADPIQYHPPEIWVQHMQNVKISEDSKWLEQRPPISNSPDSSVKTPFQTHVGPMASGAAVIEDKDIFSKLEQSNRKVIGLDMEASALAALAATHNIPFIVAKGVVDYADHSKDDRFHQFAARASAEILLELFRNTAHLLETPSSQIMNYRKSQDKTTYPTHTETDFRELINALADLYPGVTEARAVWERAGGRSRDVESISRPVDLWQRLWKNSLNGARVSPQSLLEATLEDFPDNEILKKYLKVVSHP